MIPIKSGKEIEAMRLACQTASDILAKISTLLCPGITTREVDRAAADLIAEAGCKSAFLGYRLGSLVYPGNICISVNDEVVHGIAGPRTVQYGDIVKLDVGVIRNGWVGDTASTISVGEVGPRVAKLLEVTQEALQRGIAKATAGARLGEVSSAIHTHVLANGFSVVKDFVGHGVGRKLHEEPQIPNYGSPKSGPKLKAGMTLAIEPMVNLGTSEVATLEDGWTVITLDHQPSAHFEHTILVTNEEPEILTWREASFSRSRLP